MSATSEFAHQPLEGCRVRLTGDRSPNRKRPREQHRTAILFDLTP